MEDGLKENNLTGGAGNNVTFTNNLAYKNKLKSCFCKKNLPYF